MFSYQEIVLADNRMLVALTVVFAALLASGLIVTI
jgi:hypothetical protein